jgi:hypothetical protein
MLMIKSLKVRKWFFKNYFAESKKNSRWRYSSPRVFFALGEEYLHREFFSSPRIIIFTLGEELFAESSRFGSHQRVFLSAKAPSPVVGAPSRHFVAGHAGELHHAGLPSLAGVGRASPRPCGGGGLVGETEGEGKRGNNLCKRAQAETATASISHYAA